VDTGRYAKLFLSESRENLSEINNALLEMERGGSDAALARMFRAVHTMKGMGAAMGYTSVAELSHELETLLDKLRSSAIVVTRPVIDNIASAPRRSWPNVVGSRHWLKHAKRTIISGMGGCSLCRVGLGNPYSTRGSTALPHFYTGLNRPASSPSLAKVLSIATVRNVVLVAELCYAWRVDKCQTKSFLV